MPSSPSDAVPRAVAVKVRGEELTITLADGRRVTVPLSWYPRLQNATPAQRQRWELLGDGEGIHWPDVDEDVSIAGVLRGARAPDARRGRP